MKNATGVTEVNSNTTCGTVTGNETIVTDSNVISGGSVDNSTLSGSNVTQNTTVDDSTVIDIVSLATKPVVAEMTAPTVGVTPTKPGGWGLIGFTAVFAIVGVLTVVWVVVRRRRRD